MIRAQGLSRTFRTRRGPVEAVRGVDFSVKAGEIVGFLGPNGAGKTTTLRMLTTLLLSTSYCLPLPAHLTAAAMNCLPNGVSSDLRSCPRSVTKNHKPPPICFPAHD